MARYTCFSRFGISVATETGCRIDAAVKSMPGKVIPAMGKPAIIFGLIAGGGLQLNPHGVAIITETLAVAHGAYIIILIGRLAMAGRKNGGMVEFTVREIFFCRIMTIGAEAEIFPFLIRMPEGRDIAAAHSCASEQNPKRQEYYNY